MHRDTRPRAILEKKSAYEKPKRSTLFEFSRLPFPFFWMPFFNEGQIRNFSLKKARAVPWVTRRKNGFRFLKNSLLKGFPIWHPMTASYFFDFPSVYRCGARTLDGAFLPSQCFMRQRQIYVLFLYKKKTKGITQSISPYFFAFPWCFIS